MHSLAGTLAVFFAGFPGHEVIIAETEGLTFLVNVTVDQSQDDDDSGAGHWD